MKIHIQPDGSEHWFFSVNHVSEDPDFRELPLRSFVLKACGDGMSSLALENEQSVLLLTPNVSQVKNKVVQYVHTQDFGVEEEEDYPVRHRYEGEVFGVWSGVKTDDVKAYVERCREAQTPVKLMCVYDSMPKCDFLFDELDVIAVDESDMLQEYAQLKAVSRDRDNKSDAITRVLSIAEEYADKTVFFSATSVGESYLPEFVKDFRQIRILTPNRTPATPILMHRNKPFLALKREIVLPLLKDGQVVLRGKKGEEVTFTKCIICINSVDQICKILRECEIPKELVAVGCGDTNKNARRISGKASDLNPSHLPMLTFLTTSDWRAIDIDDKEAITIVVSSTKKAYHMVSINTQLEQAIRRQRNKQNPHYNHYVFIYDVNDFEKTEAEILQSMESIRARYQSNINILNEKLEAGEDEAYQHALKTFNADSGFVRFVNFETGQGLVFNENLYKALLHRLQVTRRAYTYGFASIEQQLPVKPVIIEAPSEADPSSFTTLLKLFRQQKKTQLNVFTDEQMASDNYHLIQKYQKVYGKLPTQQKTARMKLAYAADNMPAQYTIDMVSPFKLGKRYTSKQVEDHMKRLFQKYELDSKTDMATLLSALEENGVKLLRKKSSVIYYEVQTLPEMETTPIKTD